MCKRIVLDSICMCMFRKPGTWLYVYVECISIYVFDSVWQHEDQPLSVKHTAALECRYAASRVCHVYRAHYVLLIAVRVTTQRLLCSLSQAEYMAKFEQYRRARADARPESACTSGQQPMRLAIGGGAARVKQLPGKQSAVNLKPERTPLRSSRLQS